jgi:hypothetical protein
MQEKKSLRTPKNTTGRLIPYKLTTPGKSFAAALRGKAEEQKQPQTHQVAGPATMEPRVPVALPQQKQQKAGQSVRVPNVNSLSLVKMLKVVVTIVQQIMTQSNGAVLEEDKIVHIDVALFSETHLKPHERLCILNYHFFRTDHHPGRKGGTAVAVRRGVPHSYADLPLLVSVEATGVCIRIGNSEILLASVYNFPGRARIDANITEFQSFRRRYILVGDLNAKHPFWGSAVSNPSGEKVMALFDLSEL